MCSRRRRASPLLASAGQASLCTIGDRPLIQWVWQCARAGGAASVIVATDDCPHIRFGPGFRRGVPDDLSPACLGYGSDRRSGAGAGLCAGRYCRKPAGRRAHDARSGGQRSRGSVERAAGDRHRDGRRAHSIVGGISRSQLRKGAARPRWAGLVLQPAHPGAWPRDGVAASTAHPLCRRVATSASMPTACSSLLRFASWPPTPLEKTESLEQLRALEHGMRIHLVTLSEAPPAGVDTPDDLERVRASHSGPAGAALRWRYGKCCSCAWAISAAVRRQREYFGICSSKKRPNCRSRSTPREPPITTSANLRIYVVNEPPCAAASILGPCGRVRSRPPTSRVSISSSRWIAPICLNSRQCAPRIRAPELQLFLEYAPGWAGWKFRRLTTGDASGFEEVLDFSAAASRGLLAALQKGA